MSKDSDVEMIRYFTSMGVNYRSNSIGNSVLESARSITLTPYSLMVHTLPGRSR